MDAKVLAASMELTGVAIVEVGDILRGQPMLRGPWSRADAGVRPYTPMCRSGLGLALIGADAMEEPAPLLSRLCFGTALIRRGSDSLSLGFAISIFANYRMILALPGMAE